MKATALFIFFLGGLAYSQAGLCISIKYDQFFSRLCEQSEAIQRCYVLLNISGLEGLNPDTKTLDRHADYISSRRRLKGVMQISHSQGHSFSTPMVEIPGGNFIAGDFSDSEKNKAEVAVDSFFIDEFETTNAEFVKVFPDHAYPKGAEEHPASHLTWAQAKAYCERQGKRLPSALEWEKAARGEDGRIYPWGNKALRKKPHPFYSGLIKRRVGFNKKDISPYGVRNMASSVWEWTADVQDGKAIARGGLWNLHLDYETSKTFEDIRLPPQNEFIFLGFRCARSP